MNKENIYILDTKRTKDEPLILNPALKKAAEAYIMKCLKDQELKNRYFKS